MHGFKKIVISSLWWSKDSFACDLFNGKQKAKHEKYNIWYWEFLFVYIISEEKKSNQQINIIKIRILILLKKGREGKGQNKQ